MLHILIIQQFPFIMANKYQLFIMVEYDKIIEFRMNIMHVITQGLDCHEWVE